MNLKEKLDALVESGWLVSQDHPTLDLTIYNYSQKTQFERYWVKETLMARGLVLNSQGKIIAKPFPKFFNASEVADQIPNTEFEVFEKVDGSLGIFFWYAHEDELHPVFASRGSFTSEQAQKGWELLKQFPYHSLAYGHTYMFEILYPENRIVVDYEGFEGVVLLGIIETATGREISRKTIEDHLGKDFCLVRKYSYSDSWKALQARNEPNQEGYVIRYANGFRVKVKFDEYVRLHKIITNCNILHIWDLLRTGSAIDALIDNVPDEYYKWVKECIRALNDNYNRCQMEIVSHYNKLMQTQITNRKDQAIWIAEHVPDKYRHIVFLLLDGKHCHDQIWKLIKPSSKNLKLAN